jgi:hypothetical protein
MRVPADLEESSPAFYEMLVDIGQGGDEEPQVRITDLDEHAEPIAEYRGQLALIDVDLLMGHGGVRGGAKVVAKFRSTETDEEIVGVVLIDSVQQFKDTGPTQRDELEENPHDVLSGLSISDADRTKAVRKTLSILRRLWKRLV